MDLKRLGRLIAEITVDAYGDDEQFSAFRQVIEDEVELPAEGVVIGEPVRVMAVDYDGNERRGLTARCRRENGAEYEVALPEVCFPQGTTGADYVAAYRKWLNIDPFPAGRQASAQSKRQAKAKADDLDLSRPVELVVLAVKDRAVPCRLLGTGAAITLRANRHWDLAPGEIVVVQPRKQWRYGGHPYLSGEIESIRLDIEALGLVPLGLEDRGMWDPTEDFWGEEGEPIEEWARPIIALGPRPAFEMEQVLPGVDLDDPFSDPITHSTDLKYAGQRAEAEKILMELCRADLRCLDAHSHLGNLDFDHHPQDAIRHYEVGLRIGELSLGADFDGLLPWGHIDNRPFLRCMQGYGLCLWRLGRFDEAERIFNRMLWLNPSDNQGIRFIIEEVKANKPWKDREDEDESNDDLREGQMDLKVLAEIPPWEWPQDVDRMFLAVLADDRADADDRVLAAELAGDFTVINEELVEALLSVLQNQAESEELRGTAAIALGPVLEYADTGGFDDMDDNPVSEDTIDNIQETLRRFYLDAVVPKIVRRRILEASVRSGRDWHQNAVRAAWSGDDEDWRLTAVFAMRWVGGFENQILEALESDNPDILYEAVCAAGNWALEAAWPHVSEILKDKTSDKDLFLAAIDAAAAIQHEEAVMLLLELTDSDDEDIVNAAHEAMAMVDGLSEDDFDDYDNEDEDDAY